MAEQTVHLQKSGYRRNDRVEMLKPIESLNCSLFLLARFLCACHSSSFLLVEIRGGRFYLEGYAVGPCDSIPETKEKVMRFD